MQLSQQHANAACNFFEGILKHTADEWWGKPFILAPWEEEALVKIFGQIDERGNRTVSMSYLEIPKKSGKTEWAAGLVLLVLMLDPNPGCQVYGAAAGQRQAMNVYRAACKMVEQSPLLKKKLRILRGTSRITRRSDPDSFYAAVAADGDLSDGVNPAFVVADELHRWRTRKQIENWDVLSLGGITRKQTLTVAITTAGVQSESPLAWRMHEKTKRISEGLFEDSTFYGRIYGADPDDDWTKESTWLKANPSLKQNGGFLDISKIREKYESSLSDAEAQTAFRRYYLNYWGQQNERCIDMQQWDACRGDWTAKGLLPIAPEDTIRPLPHEVLQKFFGRTCYGGVDLSMTTDMSAVSFLFPADDGCFDVLPFYWMPADGLRKRELKDGMPYGMWAKDGFLELSEGNVIDYREIKARLIWAAQMFDLKSICFDPWNSRQLSTQLLDEGYPCKEVRQGYATLSEPSKKFLELVASKKLRHGGHPILRFNASCLSTKENNDNLMFAKPERSKDTARIDGIAATVDALVEANVALPESQPRVDAW